MRHPKLFLVLFVFTLLIAVPNTQATGTWNGQDTLHVPISWCPVTGSPAQAAPNIAGDTDTDAILWRRHERPTDNIFVNPTGITFRSAINNSWGSFNFPQIADPDQTLATISDMRGEDVNAFGAEFNTLINNCDVAYNGLGRAGIGITAVNAGLFHDATGAYIGVIGWGGCADIGGVCAAPFTGLVALIDNAYLHPGSPDRTFPPSAADPGGNLQFTVTDSMDVLTGHEFGHALSLDHRAVNTALMNPSITDNNANGDVDNVNLNATEITALRANALNVPGLETDPQGQFNPGQFVANRQPDAVQENPDLPAYLDLASVRAVLDTKANSLILEQQLFGPIPERGEPITFAFLVDLDGEERGMTEEEGREMGLVETPLAGIDLVGIVTVRGGQTQGRVFIIRDGELITLDRGFDFTLLSMTLHPQFAPLSGPGGRLPEDRGYVLHHIVRLQMDNELVGIRLDNPFLVQTLILDNQRVTDRLEDEGRGRDFVLELPRFAHCGVEDGTPGGTAQATFNGLLANAPIHALIGPNMVYTGNANGDGGGTFGLPIPADTAPGYHLVTIGVDATALTADCTILVVDDGRPDGGIPRDEFALLSSHEDLLRRQSQLLELLGLLIRDLAAIDEIPRQSVLSLVEAYARLLTRHGELLADFAEMVRQSFDE